MKFDSVILSLCLCISTSVSFGQYTGTASVTQGLATTTTNDLYICANGRTTDLGSITATDNSTWVVPSDVNYSDPAFPFASDLHNACEGNSYSDANAALAALDGSDIITVDSGGELITAYIFADNYFEMYINGVEVGKDKVPFTEFNSSIVRFRANAPFTIAMLLVDWEENLGLGSEESNGFGYHPGDGGMVAVFKDSSGSIIATTGSDWTAQTFYTAPITDLSCPTETGTLRSSENCSTQDSNDGTSYYGLHWSIPSTWNESTFDDSDWPAATTYTNNEIGVNNKPSYTNFTSIFDDVSNDAEFIWSTNVILDNEVIVRYNVEQTASLEENSKNETNFKLFPNPSNSEVQLILGDNMSPEMILKMRVTDFSGKVLREKESFSSILSLQGISPGCYWITLDYVGGSITEKLIIQ